MNAAALVLFAALAAQAATNPGAGPTAHQKELVKSMEHWALVVPADSQDPELRMLAERLGTLRKQAAPDTRLSAQESGKVQAGFDAWKDEVARKLAASSGRADFSAYRADLETGVKGLAAIAEDGKIKAQDTKKVAAQLTTLRSIVGPVAAEYYFDRSKTKKGVGVLAAARADGSTEKLFNFKGWVGQPRNLKPDGAPVPAYTPVASWGFTSGAGQSLTEIISGVSRTAKAYAGKVSDAIVTFSRKYGIDEKLQAALIWAESAFNPSAKSYAGAMGLGQLMPGTARGLGVKNAYDIEQNVRGSADFLSQLFEKFSTKDELTYTQGLFAVGKVKVQQGRSQSDVFQKEIFPKIPLGVKNAIAAYNAGAGAITKYAKGDYNNLPVTRTKEAEQAGKGYWQTLKYVPKVLGYYFDITVKSPSGARSVFSV